MLSLWRRHLHECPHRNKGREYTKCSCPIWCDGNLKGKRHRQSLKTRNWQRALRLADHLEHPETERFDLIPCEQRGCNHRVESGRCEKHRRTLKEAIAIFFSAHPDLGHETLRNYTRALKFLAAHVEKAKLQWVDEITADEIESLRPTRKISALTWSKELEILRQFFRYCVARKWTSESPASKEAGVKMPKNIKPTDKEPYDPNDVVKIVAACDAIGQQPYERLRARAMTPLLRCTALRISDVALFRKDRIRHGEIYLRTLKAGKVVKLPVRPELQEALDALPEPRGTNGESKYFFWSGNGTARSVIRDATRTMASVFKKSGVPKAHAHRFRHTLATEILENGGSIEEAAEVLGNSPNIIRKHYAKWSPKRQAQINALFHRIFGTPLARENSQALNNKKR